MLATVEYSDYPAAAAELPRICGAPRGAGRRVIREMKHGFGANGSIEVVEDEQAGAGGRNFDLVYSPARLGLALELDSVGPRKQALEVDGSLSNRHPV